MHETMDENIFRRQQINDDKIWLWRIFKRRRIRKHTKTTWRWSHLWSNDRWDVFNKCAIFMMRASRTQICLFTIFEYVMLLSWTLSKWTFNRQQSNRNWYHIKVVKLKWNSCKIINWNTKKNLTYRPIN